MMKFLGSILLFFFATCAFASEVPCKNVKPLYFENYGVSIPSDWSCVANRDDKSKEFTHGYFFIKGEKRIHLLEIPVRPWPKEEDTLVFDNPKEKEPDKTINAYFNWFAARQAYMTNDERYKKVNKFVNGSRGVLFSKGKKFEVIYYEQSKLLEQNDGKVSWQRIPLVFIFNDDAPKEFLVTSCKQCTLEDMFNALIFPVIKR
jgi:hypothetical protein